MEFLLKIIGFLYVLPLIVSGHNTNNATGQGFLPVHPEVKETDKNSVPPAKGKEITLGNLTVYESPSSKNSTLLLVTTYDLFGFHPHVKYFADQLAESGFLVVIPDLFHGKPITLDEFLLPNFTQRAVPLFAKDGSWKESNKKDLLKVIKHYKHTREITGIGMYGFCWGGKIAVYAGSDPDFDLNAVGLVHPARVTDDDAKELRVPAGLYPSQTEPDMLPFLGILNNKLKNGLSEHYRYGNMSHGFAGARGDFSDPNVRTSVQDVIRRLASFFKRTLPKSK